MADAIISTRRALLKSLPVAGVAVAVSASALVAAERSTPQEEIDRATGTIATAMRTLHGGEWLVFVDHAAGVVSVSRDFSSGVSA